MFDQQIVDPQPLCRRCMDDVHYTPKPPTGGPGLTFSDPFGTAKFWASIAPRNELVAYAVASFEALSMSDQDLFRAHIGDEVTFIENH